MRPHTPIDRIARLVPAPTRTPTTKEPCRGAGAAAVVGAMARPKLEPRITYEPSEWLDVFVRSARRRECAAEETLIDHGATANTIYYVLDGSVCAQIEDDDGREIVLGYLFAGDFFGEMGLFGKDRRRSARVITRGKCVVAEMSYEQFRRVAGDYPELLFAVAGQMADRLRRNTSQIRHLVLLDVTARVAATLIELAGMPDAMTHPDGMQLRITRVAIAGLVGCSREMVGRVLKELEARGLIHARGKTIIVYGTR